MGVYMCMEIGVCLYINVYVLLPIFIIEFGELIYFIKLHLISSITPLFNLFTNLFLFIYVYFIIYLFYFLQCTLLHYMAFTFYKKK